MLGPEVTQLLFIPLVLLAQALSLSWGVHATCVSTLPSPVLSHHGEGRPQDGAGPEGSQAASPLHTDEETKAQR